MPIALLKPDADPAGFPGDLDDFDCKDPDLLLDTDGPAPETRSVSNKKTYNRRGPANADKRAVHNAVERARRESLNGSFMELAEAIPAMASVKRPSKAAIVNNALAYIYDAQIREHGLVTENNTLRREIDDLRVRLDMPPLPPPEPLPASAKVETLQKARKELASLEAASDETSSADDAASPAPTSLALIDSALVSPATSATRPELNAHPLPASRPRQPSDASSYGPTTPELVTSPFRDTAAAYHPAEPFRLAGYDMAYLMQTSAGLAHTTAADCAAMSAPVGAPSFVQHQQPNPYAANHLPHQSFYTQQSLDYGHFGPHSGAASPFPVVPWYNHMPAMTMEGKADAVGYFH